MPGSQAKKIQNSYEKESAIFIGGCPRSGTTMLADHLSGITGCVATPETQFLSDPKVLSAAIDPLRMQSLLADDYRFRNWGIPRNKLSKMNFENLNRLTFDLVGHYASQNAKHFQIWIDHTPANFKRFNQMRKTFPKSHFIQIVRDPRAVVNSVIKLDWGPNTVTRASEWWLIETSLPLALKAVYPSEITLVKYEDVVSANSQWWMSLVEKIGINPTSNDIKRVARGGNFHVPKYTRNQHSLVGTTGNAHKISNWRDFMSSRQVEIVEAHTYELMVALGYEPSFVQPKKATHLEKLRSLEWPVELKSRPLKKASKWIRERSVGK